jgi:competence protein ComFC
MLVNNHNVACYSGAYYSGIVKELISRLKYRSDFKAGEALSIYMIQSINTNKLSFDLITYVPSTRKTLKKRGYNQSEFLAKIIGDKINTKVVGILGKVRDTKDQIGLSGEERWNNLKDSYKVKKAECIRGKVILLVDDVITTGATGFFCAEDMLKSGAREVHILTAARSNV